MDSAEPLKLSKRISVIVGASGVGLCGACENDKAGAGGVPPDVVDGGAGDELCGACEVGKAGADEVDPKVVVVRSVGLPYRT